MGDARNHQRENKRQNQGAPLSQTSLRRSDANHARNKGFVGLSKKLDAGSSLGVLNREAISEISIINGYVPGSLGRIVVLHGAFYHEHGGLGRLFESAVARQLGEFLDRYDPERDGLWLVLVDGRVEGSIVIDGAPADSEGARLRWFIVSERLRGRGLGNTLLNAALDFCREKGYDRVYLWTVNGLTASTHLCQKNGFALTHQVTTTGWGAPVDEQRLELQLQAPPNGAVKLRRRAARLIATVKHHVAERQPLHSFLLGAVSMLALYGLWIWHPLRVSVWH